MRAIPAFHAIPELQGLKDATVVDIKDEWMGMGSTRDLSVRMTRAGRVFHYKARRQLPPTCPNGECSPEAKYSVRAGVVDASKVEAFLAVIAKHGRDPDQSGAPCMMFDDHPSVHVVVSRGSSSSAVDLSHTTCARQWQANGVILSPDPVVPGDFLRNVHTPINAAYSALLNALGVDE